MSIHEWIQQGAMSDEIAKKRGLKELVRCKDCIHYNKEKKWCQHMEVANGGNWFCADGKRKEGR